jgi:hypothetical protein
MSAQCSVAVESTELRIQGVYGIQEVLTYGPFPSTIPTVQLQTLPR